MNAQMVMECSIHYRMVLHVMLGNVRKLNLTLQNVTIIGNTNKTGTMIGLNVLIVVNNEVRNMYHESAI